MPHWTSIPIGRDGRDSLFDRSMDVDFDRPIRIFDQNFGLGLREEDIVPSSYSPYYSRGRRLYSRQQSGVGEMKVEAGRWQVMLDVQHFSPQELNVRTVEQTLEVEAKHEEKEDFHGLVSRQFCRKYKIPEEFEATSAISSLSKDGILTVTMEPKPAEQPKASARTVPISTTEPEKV